jgi:hypothetical protein
MRMSARTVCSAVIATVTVLTAGGCSHYSVSGSLPSGIRNVAVPLFENQTVEPGIVEAVTETVINAIISNGQMKVVGESQSDAMVNGIITDVRDEADSYSRSEQAKQFRLRIFADVSFYDRRKNRAIWEEKRLEGWARYDAADPAAREKAKAEALKMLAGLIIDKTVSGW